MEGRDGDGDGDFESFFISENAAAGRDQAEILAGEGWPFKRDRHSGPGLDLSQNAVIDQFMIISGKTSAIVRHVQYLSVCLSIGCSLRAPSIVR